MIAFATTNLTPDLQRVIGWLVSETLAWLLSLTPQQLAYGVWCASAALAALMFVICRVVTGRRGDYWR